MIALQPFAKFGAEGFIFTAIVEIHCALMTVFVPFPLAWAG